MQVHLILCGGILSNLNMSDMLFQRYNSTGKDESNWNTQNLLKLGVRNQFEMLNNLKYVLFWKWYMMTDFSVTENDIQIALSSLSYLSIMKLYNLEMDCFWSFALFPSVQIPTNSSGLIEFRKHPFWSQQYCPSHEKDGTPRCCSCERMEVLFEIIFYLIFPPPLPPGKRAYYKEHLSFNMSIINCDNFFN